MTNNQLEPFNKIPDLPPGIDLETKEVLKKCIDSRSALAEINSLARTIPNQAILINTLPILEAKGSSEIENIVTTADKLFQYSQTDLSTADPATKEALRYRTALSEGFQSLKDKPLSTNTAVTVCSTIKGREMDVRKVPGTKLVNGPTGEVIYTPPEGESLLRQKLGNWERFLHGSVEIDPLVRMAVGHYQFEAIHPFTDGNGRTGRILNLLYLNHEGLLDLPILYLSRYIIRHKSDYYQLLREVTMKANWVEWVLYMLKAVEETSKWTSQKIAAITDLMDHTKEHLKSSDSGIYSRELIEIIFTQPYCRIAHLTEMGIAKRQTASAYLKRLCDLGILQEVKVGRDKLFVHPRLVDLLANDSSDFRRYKS